MGVSHDPPKRSSGVCWPSGLAETRSRLGCRLCAAGALVAASCRASWAAAARLWRGWPACKGVAVSAFTDRLYASWLRVNGQSRPGYGAKPHGSEAKPPKGYPQGQPSPAQARQRSNNPQRIATAGVGARALPSRPAAVDPRPEKPVLAVRVSALPSINSQGSDYVYNVA